MELVKRKFFFDFEKEEKFLNEMMANGLALKSYSWGKYTFEKAPKGEYIYRLELLENPVDHEESQEYIRFMEETGAELVTFSHHWAYFRKKAADGDFQIYTDLSSKIKYYMRIRMFLLVFVFLNLFLGLINLNLGYLVDFSRINHYVAIVSFLAVAFLTSFILPLNKKINTLKKENEIHE